MQNKLFSVDVKTEKRESTEHEFYVSLEFCSPIREKDARDWLQRVIADAAPIVFEVPDK